MKFTSFDILNEFVEADKYGHNDRSFLCADLVQAVLYTRARVLRAQRTWIAKPANREKKRLAMIEYRKRKPK
jgi:hypothetical protein